MPTPEPRLFDGTRFVADRWRNAEPGEAPAPGEYVIFPAEEAPAGDAAKGTVGLRIEPGTALASLGDLTRFALIALTFPKFSDGRAYSLGHRLRTTYAFKGEMRACGDVLFDQLQLMLRCGFDTFEIRDPVTLALLDEGRRPDVRRFYQPGFGTERPAGTRPWTREHL